MYYKCNYNVFSDVLNISILPTSSLRLAIGIAPCHLGLVFEKLTTFFGVENVLATSDDHDTSTLISE